MNRLIIETHADRLRAARAIAKLPPGSVVELREPADGTQLQLNRLWGLLGDLAEQTDWQGEQLSAADWLDLFLEQAGYGRVVDAIGSARTPQGREVTIGLHVRRLTKAQLTDLADVVRTFGYGDGVKFSYEPPLRETDR